MKAKLRGHHLICLNFFRGEGYSEEFIKNIYATIEKDEIAVVEGPDDVCLKCPHLKDGRCANNEYTDEMIHVQDHKALRLLGFRPGMVVDWKIIASRLPGILGEWKTRFCAGCGYYKVCFNE